MALVQLVLDNATVATESEEFSACLAFWRKASDLPRWSASWATPVMAASEHTALCLESYMDRIAGYDRGMKPPMTCACGFGRAWTGCVGRKGGAVKLWCPTD